MRTIAVITVALLMLPPGAPGLVNFYKDGQLLEAPALPRGVRDVFNSRERFVVVASEGRYLCACRGSTEALNLQLRYLAGVPRVRWRVEVMNDIGEVGTGEFRRSNQRYSLERFDWTVEFGTTAIEGGAATRPEEWDGLVVISFAGQVKLEQLQIPMAYEAQVGGRLGRFVRKHNDRRSDGSTTRPTSEGVLPSEEPFGG